MALESSNSDINASRSPRLSSDDPERVWPCRRDHTNCCNIGNPEPNKMTKDESPMSKEIQRQRLPARARY